jgi:branched-chain amino acid transport system substrate-binding protein
MAEVKFKMKSRYVIGVMVVLVLISSMLAGCVQEETGTEIETAKTIKIGYIGPLSGPSAVLGMDAIKAIEIAVEEINAQGGINGATLEVIAEDDQYLTSKTVTAYEKLVNVDGVKVVLVAAYGGLFAIADKAKQDGIILIDPLDCNSAVAALGDHVFCLATETESIGHVLADDMIKAGEKKAAVMYSTKDPFMALVKDAFKERFEAGGGVMTEESFAYDDKDFKTALLKITESEPEGLVLLGHDETGIIMKQARDLGIEARFMTTGTITSPGAQKAAQGHAEGTVFAYWEADAANTMARTLEQKFAAKVGRPMILPLTTHPAYDTVNVLAEHVLPKAESVKGRQAKLDATKQALLNIKDVQGTTGQLTMQPDGGLRIKEAAFRLEAGMPVKV